MNNYWPEGLLLHTAQNRSLTQSAAGLHEALYSQTVLEGRVSVCTR